MEQSRDGTPRLRRRAVGSTNGSSKSDGDAENVSDIPHETTNQDAKSERAEGPRRKKNGHCFKECNSYKNPERTNHRWSAEEDEVLTQLVNKHGTKNWQIIACAIPDRTAHSCLSRWKYILDPAINKDAWSQQEELRLIRAHQVYGNKWCKMVKHFPGRYYWMVSTVKKGSTTSIFCYLMLSIGFNFSLNENSVCIYPVQTAMSMTNKLSTSCTTRTNNALKEHWRGSMKRKLDSYLASGLLEQVPDLHENLSVPQSSQSDIPKDSEVSSDRNKLSSVISTSPKLKQEPTELGENADTSVGRSSDFIYAKTPDAHSAKVSERILAKSQQSARERKKLDFLSTPVELKRDVPYETTKHCQNMESEKTEGPSRKENSHCRKDSSLKDPERTKGKWLPEEDEMLIQMATKHGLKNWQTIASAIPDRNAQQCRIRWTRSLDPAINKEAWSEQEELRLIRAHQIYGNQWLKMVKHFPGRTNHALKEHWRGPMKGKLNSYLSSGLLEQIPDLQEDPSVPESTQSDVSKYSQGSSGRVPSVLPRPKSKRKLPELDENVDTSEEESSDHIYAKGLDAQSDKVSERIMAKSKQRARARRKLDFLSTPVELKVCPAAASCQRPIPKMEQMSPAARNMGPSDVCQDVPPNVLSECVDAVLPTTAGNRPDEVYSSATPDPCSLEIHEASASNFLDMSYCDGLMIDSPSFPNGGSII